ARLHQRSLASLPPEPPATVPSNLPPLPAAFLTLPETLSALQAQITALQHQVADLTSLLQRHLPQPVSSPPPAPPLKPAKRSSQPTSPASRTRSSAPTKTS